MKPSQARRRARRGAQEFAFVRVRCDVAVSLRSLSTEQSFVLRVNRLERLCEESVTFDNYGLTRQGAIPVFVSQVA